MKLFEYLVIFFVLCFSNTLVVDPCTWSNITCSEDKKNVIAIEINGLNTTFLPEAIGYLPGLQTLTLKGGDVQGILPSNYSNLLNLKHLDISHTQVTGNLPKEYSNLKNLSQVYLNNNQLKGTLPKEWGIGLNNIERLELQDNLLTGELPLEWGNLGNKTLQHINLTYSGQKTKPEEIQTNFFVNLTGNNLSGEIPLDWIHLAGVGSKITLDNNTLGLSNIKPNSKFVETFCSTKEASITFKQNRNNTKDSNPNEISAITSISISQEFRGIGKSSNSKQWAIATCQNFQREKRKLILIIFVSFAGAAVILTVLLQLAMCILLRGSQNEEDEEGSNFIMKLYYHPTIQRLIKLSNVGFLYFSLASNIRYAVKINDWRTYIVLMGIQLLTYVIQMLIVRVHLNKRYLTLKTIAPDAIDWSQYNGYERLLIKTMWKCPLGIFRPIIIIVNQVIIEVLLVMEYALGFTKCLHKKAGLMEKAYFMDNVYDSRESIKVFVESVLNLAAQSVIYYLGGQTDSNFGSNNTGTSFGSAQIGVKESYIMAVVLSFLTVLKKILVVQLLARFNKLKACHYCYAQLNDLGGRDAYTQQYQSMEKSKFTYKDRELYDQDSFQKENIPASYGKPKQHKSFPRRDSAYSDNNKKNRVYRNKSRTLSSVSSRSGKYDTKPLKDYYDGQLRLRDDDVSFPALSGDFSQLYSDQDVAYNGTPIQRNNSGVVKKKGRQYSNRELGNSESYNNRSQINNGGSQRQIGLSNDSNYFNQIYDDDSKFDDNIHITNGKDWQSQKRHYGQQGSGGKNSISLNNQNNLQRDSQYDNLQEEYQYDNQQDELSNKGRNYGNNLYVEDGISDNNKGQKQPDQNYNNGIGRFRSSSEYNDTSRKPSMDGSRKLSASDSNRSDLQKQIDVIIQNQKLQSQNAQDQPGSPISSQSSVKQIVQDKPYSQYGGRRFIYNNDNNNNNNSNNNNYSSSTNNNKSIGGSNSVGINNNSLGGQNSMGGQEAGKINVNPILDLEADSIKSPDSSSMSSSSVQQFISDRKQRQIGHIYKITEDDDSDYIEDTNFQQNYNTRSKPKNNQSQNQRIPYTNNFKDKNYVKF